MQTVEELKTTFPSAGRVEWIGISSKSHGTIQVVDEAEAVVGKGLTGDHHAKRRESKREVTFIQLEHLQVVSALLGMKVIPELTRRNVVVGGVNLIALKDRRFRIGEVVFQGTGPCAPCSRMEANLGPGGYNAMRGHGGITAKVIDGGDLRVGDAVEFVADADEETADEPGTDEV